MFKNPVDATPNIDQQAEYGPNGALYIAVDLASIRHETLELNQSVYLSFPCKDSCGRIHSLILEVFNPIIRILLQFLHCLKFFMLAIFCLLSMMLLKSRKLKNRVKDGF